MLTIANRITIYQSYKRNETINGQEVQTDDFDPYVFQFYNIVSAKIDQSWDNITQTAQVVIPRRLKRFGATKYKFIDYYNINPDTFTRHIDNIIHGSTGLLENYIDLDNNISGQGNSPRYKPIINKDPNYNNGNAFLDTTRVNPLISHGDIIVIQLGYIIKDRSNNYTFKTIDSGNVGLKNNVLTNSLPTYLQKLPPVSSDGDSVFNINNRYKPYNRGYQFRGYIKETSIDKQGNIVLDCQDYMYLFDQARVSNYTFDPALKLTNVLDDSKLPTTLNNILQTFQYNSNLNAEFGTDTTQIQSVKNINTLPRPVIQPTNDNGIPFTNYGLYYPFSYIINDPDSTLGIIQVEENATIGDVFRYIKENYLIPLFFRPNTDILNTSPFVYNLFSNGIVPTLGPSSSKFGYANYTGPNGGSEGQEEFTFIMGQYSTQSELSLMNLGYLKNAVPGTYLNSQNILSYNLDFKHTDDTFVGAVVKSFYRTNATHSITGDVLTTTDGRTKTKPVEYTTHVGDYGGLDYTFMYLPTNQKDIESGGNLDINKLDAAMKSFGRMKLSHLNYEGYYGDFTTFGYPYVQFSDIVNIIDFSFPERCGRYYVKKVIYNMDQQNGATQQIFLDYKLQSINVNTGIPISVG